MKPADILGFTPIRRVIETDGHTVTVGVQPPKYLELPERRQTLTTDQYSRYCKWLARGGLIQELLPELTDSQRETLMTGLGDENFPKD